MTGRGEWGGEGGGRFDCNREGCNLWGSKVVFGLAATLKETSQGSRGEGEEGTHDRALTAHVWFELGIGSRG